MVRMAPVMPDLRYESLPHWPVGAYKVLDQATIQAGMDELARRVDAQLGDDEPITVMAIMNGGLIPAADLVRRLQRPLKMDYVHATRYRNERFGSELDWRRWPDSIQGTIVLVDDIFDEGHTMAAVRERLMDEGATRVITAVAACKQHDRGLARDWVDAYGFVLPDAYVFGYGLDYQGLWRQLDEIWALPP